MVLMDISAGQLLAGTVIEKLTAKSFGGEVFRIPIPFIDDGIPVYKATIIMWIVIAVIVLLCVILTHNLKVEPKRREMLLESIVSPVRNFFRKLKDKKNKKLRFVVFLLVLAVLLIIATLCGFWDLFGSTVGGHDKSVSEEITEQIECVVVFSIPVPFVEGGIPVYESTIGTWIIMAVLVIASILLTRNLKLVPDKKQMMLESAVGFIRNFVRDTIGEKGMCYFPYLGTVLIYIGFSDIIGLFGIKPPTKDLSVTIALALMSIVLIEFANIRARGFGGFLKSFAKPTPIMIPMNILEIGIRPLSLCMRLFGNVVGAFIIMELIKYICPVLLPLPFSFYFDIFDGCLQAYIFVFLTSIFIQEAIEDD